MNRFYNPSIITLVTMLACLLQSCDTVSEDSASGPVTIQLIIEDRPERSTLAFATKSMETYPELNEDGSYSIEFESKDSIEATLFLLEHNVGSNSNPVDYKSISNLVKINSESISSENAIKIKFTQNEITQTYQRDYDTEPYYGFLSATDTSYSFLSVRREYKAEGVDYMFDASSQNARYSFDDTGTPHISGGSGHSRFRLKFNSSPKVFVWGGWGRFNDVESVYAGEEEESYDSGAKNYEDFYVGPELKYVLETLVNDKISDIDSGSFHALQETKYFYCVNYDSKPMLYTSSESFTNQYTEFPENLNIESGRCTGEIPADSQTVYRIDFPVLSVISISVE